MEVLSTAAMVVGVLLSMAVAWLVGSTLAARFVDWAWQRLHGPERTDRVRYWVAGLVVAPAALTSAALGPDTWSDLFGVG